MDIFWIPDPDPHNNRCGSATLVTGPSYNVVVRLGLKDERALQKIVVLFFPLYSFPLLGNVPDSHSRRPPRSIQEAPKKRRNKNGPCREV